MEGHQLEKRVWKVMKAYLGNIVREELGQDLLGQRSEQEVEITMGYMEEWSLGSKCKGSGLGTSWECSKPRTKL